MKDTVFNDFYKSIGHKTYSSASSDWIEIQRGMLLSVPFHRIITPSESELEKLFADSKVLGVRFPTVPNGYGFNSSLTMCRKADYGMSSLTSKARNQVRKGQNNFEIRDVSYPELLTDGLGLNKKTFARQKRDDPKSDEKVWEKICGACFSVAGVKVYGAYYEKRLAAYMIVLETATAAEIIIQNSDSDLLSLCPNNVLAYTVTSKYLSANGTVLPVCYGLGSLEVTESLDHFKAIMGYDFEPIKQRLVFNRKIRPFLKPVTLHMLSLLKSKVFKKNYFIRKCHGLLSCYLGQTIGTDHV